MNKKALYGIVLVTFLTGVSVWLYLTQKEERPALPLVTNFEECASAGNPIMESYPRRCASGGQTFTEEIKQESDINNLIHVTNPLPNQLIKSPLIIEGEARGVWFFEASFPVVLTDWDGLIIAEGFATAQGEWMTEEFVPFIATLEFKTPTYKNNGVLILKKDNPSGLPEHDRAFEIPVIFKDVYVPAMESASSSLVR